MTDNQCRVQDNQTQLLSDNETDVNLLSGNVAHILSGIHVLSGISVDVQITIGGNDGQAPGPKAKKGHGKNKSRKTDKRTAARKPKA